MNNVQERHIITHEIPETRLELTHDFKKCIHAQDGHDIGDYVGHPQIQADIYLEDKLRIAAEQQPPAERLIKMLTEARDSENPVSYLLDPTLTSVV